MHVSHGRWRWSKGRTLRTRRDVLKCEGDEVGVVIFTWTVRARQTTITTILYETDSHPRMTWRGYQSRRAAEELRRRRRDEA